MFRTYMSTIQIEEGPRKVEAHQQKSVDLKRLKKRP